jgi:hypothetical protein
MSLQQTSKFEFAVRPSDSIRIDGQINRELAHCGKLIARHQRTGSHTAAHLVDDLAIDRYTAVKVKPQTEWRPMGTHYEFNVLVN